MVIRRFCTYSHFVVSFAPIDYEAQGIRSSLSPLKIINLNPSFKTMFPAQAVVRWRAFQVKFMICVSVVLIGICSVLPARAQTPVTNPPTSLPDTTKQKSDTTKAKPATPATPVDTSKVIPVENTTLPANIPVVTDSSASDMKPLTEDSASLSDSTRHMGADSTAYGMGKLTDKDINPDDEGGIGKLEDCEIPFTMAYHIKNMTFGELDTLRIEFQKIIKEEDEEDEEKEDVGEEIITIKMRYRNDHIVGYMTKAPLHHSNQYVIINRPINVKIAWCCVPDSTHPTQHCASNRAELLAIDSTEHCKAWKQQDDGTEMLDQLAANQKKIDMRKYKKKHKFRPFGWLDVFKRKKKKKMIAIPLDKTLPEILKSGSSS